MPNQRSRSTRSGRRPEAQPERASLAQSSSTLERSTNTQHIVQEVTYSSGTADLHRLIVTKQGKGQHAKDIDDDPERGRVTVDENTQRRERILRQTDTSNPPTTPLIPMDNTARTRGRFSPAFARRSVSAPPGDLCTTSDNVSFPCSP